MPKKIIRNLQFGVGFSLLILLTSSAASYWSIQKQIENRENLSRSRRAITSVKDVLIALLDAETGNRGFQLTGKENFLEPYKRSLLEFPKAMESAKSLDIGDKKQLDRLKKLEENVHNNIANLKQFVENKRSGKQMTQE
jgi:CHASE3 domain sensor protein